MYDFYYLIPAVVTLVLVLRGFIYVRRCANQCNHFDTAPNKNLVLHSASISSVWVLIWSLLVWMVFLVGDLVVL